MKKQLPIFLALLLIVAVVVKKRFMVDMENETVQEIINEFEIIPEDVKPIAEEVKPKVKLKEKHIEKVQQKAAKTKKIVEQDLSREEGEYDDGKKDGLWKYWDKKGIKEKEIIFEKGDDILWLFFGTNGNKTREGQMVDGKEEGVWTFYDEEGIKERETEHKSGKEDGIYSLWYDNGQKQEEGPYKVHTRIGLWTWWHDNGEKWQEGAYLNGERDGTWRTWKKNGEKWKEVVYNNGEFVTKKEY
jgi:antitoxin component YwqK of YwqJK toxin-antitoxin module